MKIQSCEILRKFISLARFEKLNTYGESQAKQLGLKPRDINRLIAEVRFDS